MTRNLIIHRPCKANNNRGQVTTLQGKVNLSSPQSLGGWLLCLSEPLRMTALYLFLSFFLFFLEMASMSVKPNEKGDGLFPTMEVRLSLLSILSQTGRSCVANRWLCLKGQEGRSMGPRPAAHDEGSSPQDAAA